LRTWGDLLINNFLTNKKKGGFNKRRIRCKKQQHKDRIEIAVDERRNTERWLTQ